MNVFGTKFRRTKLCVSAVLAGTTITGVGVGAYYKGREGFQYYVRKYYKSLTIENVGYATLTTVSYGVVGGIYGGILGLIAPISVPIALCYIKSSKE
jgi:hypothetical protein